MNENQFQQEYMCHPYPCPEFMLNREICKLCANKHRIDEVNGSIYLAPWDKEDDHLWKRECLLVCTVGKMVMNKRGEHMLKKRISIDKRPPEKCIYLTEQVISQ